MVVNDNAYLLAKRGVLESIASKLAPTEGRIACSSGQCFTRSTQHFPQPIPEHAKGQQR